MNELSLELVHSQITTKQKLMVSQETVDEINKLASAIADGGLRVTVHGPFYDLSPGAIDSAFRSLTIDRMSLSLRPGLRRRRVRHEPLQQAAGPEVQRTLGMPARTRREVLVALAALHALVARAGRDLHQRRRDQARGDHSHVQAARFLVHFPETRLLGFLALEHLDHLLADHRLFGNVRDVAHHVLDSMTDFPEFSAHECHQQSDHRHQHQHDQCQHDAF